jgi:predicted ATP-dependent protease
MPQLRRLDRGAMQLLRELDRRVIQVIAAPMIDELKRDYAQETQVVEFLDRLAADIVDHLDAFRPGEDQQRAAIAGAPPAIPDGTFNRYKVNVIVAHAQDAHAPAIFEDNPTYYQLFGRIDFRSTFGSMVTDHTMVRPGALHRANGGFLAVQAIDVLTQPLVWTTLKRALRTRQIQIENMGEQFSIIPTATLAPEPIPLDVKVAVIGSPYVFALLQNVDEDFRKLFKSRADFTIDVARDRDNEMEYARFIATQSRRLGMRPFDAGAVARVIEHSSRLAGDQEKLSLRMMDVVDLLVEADYWACEAESATVTREFVERAVEQKVYRSNLLEERLQDLLVNAIIKVDVAGAVVGQVNGLSVHDLGDYAFGRPSRITARVSLGRGQVLNIEREVQRSGPSHSKGFLILNGYLNGKFAHRQPLSFAASIAFEQLYDEVDGDSASSTELYALLSAIADVPLRQDLAVTGSVNQLGEVQAIGGVNEKVEGFYALCKARGLTGTQGVIVPRDNLRNLMLRRDVVDTVARGEFHIYAVTSVDQGIEILTGMPAGKLRKDGSYPEGSVYRKVTDALEAMTRRAIEVNRAANQREPIATTSAASSSRDGAQRRRKGGESRPGAHTR